MKKIVAIVSSPRAESSNSAEVLRRIFNQVNKFTEEYILEIVYLCEKSIHDCCGCAVCFQECRICPTFEDDIQEIERSIIESDLVFFVSPVYAHNINGLMKKFIDRISYGLHILNFIGKYGFVISVSSSNGNIFVNEYLEKMMVYLGIKVLGSISVQTVREVDDSLIREHALVISDFIMDKYNRSSTELEEQYFAAMKSAIRKVAERCETNEVKYWKENHYLDYSNFEELFQEKSKSMNIIASI